MKKTLIALAALAAVTAASAQSTVTISGKFGTSYQQGLGAQASAKGKANLAVTDGDVGFLAVEDLGGGLKAGADMRLRLRGRANAVAATTQAHAAGAVAATAQVYSVSAYQETGRDGTVFLSGPFGTVTAGSIELGNGITGRGYGGTNVSLNKDLNDGGVLSSNGYGNILGYTSPAINGFTVSLTRADSIGTVNVSSKTVAATGVETDLGVNANVVGLAYANGPLTAGVDSTTFSGSTTIGGANSDRKRTRMSADYDFGIVKVGVGQEDNKGTAAAGLSFGGKQTAFGISAPIGALRVGLVYTKNAESGILGTANDTAKSTGFGADYSFSKRTILNVSSAKIQRTALADGSNYDKEGQQYRVRLMHSF